MLLEGKTAVVSGAGPGLGRSICVRFAREGANVVAADLDDAVLADTVAATAAASSRSTAAAAGVRTDITDRVQCDALFARAVDEFGRVDILVNDAYHGGDFSLFEDADLADWRATADVNLFGTLTVTQAALPALKASGSGRVIMICTHGVEVIQPTFGAYAASKAAVAQATKQLAAELGPHNIRVNAVFPGPIWGALLRGYLDQEAAAHGMEPQAMYDEFASRNALNTLLEPDVIAGSVVFLASDLAAAVSGQAIYANAGESFH
jgi:NAD(P)-dependent dehydrogenase (short-subunit alcohol dehydrogenase family)